MAIGRWAARGCLVRTLVGEVLQPPGGTLALLRRCHAGDNHACIQRQNMRGQSLRRTQGGGDIRASTPKPATPLMAQRPVPTRALLLPPSWPGQRGPVLQEVLEGWDGFTRGTVPSTARTGTDLFVC